MEGNNVENEEVKLEETSEIVEEKVVEEKKETEIAEDFKSKFYYLAAELDNAKKRFEREKDGIIKYSNERVLSDLIEVADNFERTLDAVKGDEDKKIKNIVFGIEMIYKQLMQTLSQYGLKTVETENKKFDPNFHEALSYDVVEGKEDQDIVKVIQKGYVLNERLLRAAKVAVAKKKDS